jgi:hypothetical protein
VPIELLAFLPENFAVAPQVGFRATIAFCGQQWVHRIAQLQELQGPPDRLLILHYEDFFVEPKRQLGILAALLGVDYVDDNWSSRCADTLHPPRSTWRNLAEERARTLTEA